MTSSNRLIALDSLRGFIMIVMALDHANQFIANAKLDPELWTFLFPNYGGDSVAFLTRFVTHLAAPGFFFLMGVGMTLFTLSRKAKQWSKTQIAAHFLVRGALLIVFQFALENPAWNIGLNNSSLGYFGVLYALGGAMIIGSLLTLIPTWLVASISVLLILFTEAILPVAPPNFPVFSTAQLLFTTPGFGDIFVPQTLVLYPILPWLGVMGLGMVYGRYLKNPSRTYQWTGWIGAIALILFVLIRVAGQYGNIRTNPTDDWIGFLNLVKYPPSLTFLLFTLGTNLLVLKLFTWIEEQFSNSRLLKVLAGFGQEPLFFYVAHLYLYGYAGEWLNQGNSLSIPQMIPYWLLGLLILWPLCVGYGRFKQTRKAQSLWRFL